MPLSRARVLYCVVPPMPNFVWTSSKIWLILFQNSASSPPLMKSGGQNKLACNFVLLTPIFVLVSFLKYRGVMFEKGWRLVD